MIDPNSPTTPAETAPSKPTAHGSPPTALTAPPGTALQIAQMLADGKIDTAQAGNWRGLGTSRHSMLRKC
jgi:hypothetical protein